MSVMERSKTGREYAHMMYMLLMRRTMNHTNAK